MGSDLGESGGNGVSVDRRHRRERTRGEWPTDVVDEVEWVVGRGVSRSDGLSGEQLKGLAGAVARRARGVLPSRDAEAGVESAPVPFDVKVGEVRIRPLRIADQAAWTRSMRLNEARMRPWWHGGTDWQERTSAAAFYDHYLDWALARRRGSGDALAILGEDGLVGELHCYLSHGGRSAEFGLWCRPQAVSGKSLLGALCAVVDILLGDRGVHRISAPVEAANRQPVKLLTLAGFAQEATLRDWRPVGEQMGDFTLFGMTAQQWPQARVGALRRSPWPQVVPSLPTSVPMESVGD